jgi:pectin methylesterase-like acyl-CoA thioesterase
VPSDTLAGRTVNRVLPIFIDGTDAVIYLRRGVLAPQTTYVVSIDAGVFVNAAGQPVGAAGDWTFTTLPAPSASGTLRVDRENGPFCTIQGALDAIPNDNTARVRVDVQPGSYHEMLYLTGKRNVTLRGADAATTSISYPNNERLNPGTAGRAMVTALNADGLILEDLTLFNSTPQGGSQAEALRVRGDRVILRRSRFLSRQDTLLLDGRVYVADAYVEGNVDFVWGYGSAYFERSEIKVVARSGVIVQARNDDAGRGYFFVDSRLTSNPGLTNTAFARIDVSEYPNSEVALVDCQVGPHISPEGWTVTGDADTSGLRFLEYRSTDLSGAPLDVSRRHPASRQLDATEAEALRDRASVLGGWDPEQ